MPACLHWLFPLSFNHHMYRDFPCAATDCDDREIKHSSFPMNRAECDIILWRCILEVRNIQPWITSLFWLWTVLPIDQINQPWPSISESQLGQFEVHISKNIEILHVKWQHQCGSEDSLWRLFPCFWSQPPFFNERAWRDICYHMKLSGKIRKNRRGRGF